MIKISVVIPTYNEEKNIERCLTALSQQTLPKEEYEIIVVDGNSQDNTVKIARKLADKVIQQVSEGVGGARNDGVAEATGGIIATTDADCEPFEGWLKIIRSKFKDESVVAVTGFLKPYDFSGMTPFEVFIYKRIFDVSNWVLLILSWLGYYHLCGANSAIRKKVFQNIGGYLPLAYADDVEIFKRLKNKGNILLEKKMKIHYSVRRIRKLGLLNYIFLIFKMDWNIMVLGKKPSKNNYARLDYN
jgi:glycosyltransferase involved in cell wall biosynthesis